jgi:hypothetical protein
MKLKTKKVEGLEKPVPKELKLKRVTSGGQIGVDIAALKSAKKFGLKTGGHIPQGFITLDGLKPGYGWQYGLLDDCYNYKERTWKNVHDADATLRIATDFTSRGEVCTLNAIRAYSKIHLDIFWEPSSSLFIDEEETAVWLISNQIQVLNIAGNANKELEERVQTYLTTVFNILRWC